MQLLETITKHTQHNNFIVVRHKAYVHFQKLTTELYNFIKIE